MQTFAFRQNEVKCPECDKLAQAEKDYEVFQAIREKALKTVLPSVTTTASYRTQRGTQAPGRTRSGARHCDREQPAAGCGPDFTETARTFYFDPGFTLDRNLLGAQGELPFAAGTHKNPLEVVSL